LRRIPERLAQFGDPLRENIIGNSRAGPNRIENFLTGNDRVRSLGQAVQNGHGLWFEVHRFTAALDTITMRPDSPLTETVSNTHNAPLLSHRQGRMSSLFQGLSFNSSRDRI
jgi:hypothetical protein